jgi:hypothetical protein
MFLQEIDEELANIEYERELERQEYVYSELL